MKIALILIAGFIAVYCGGYEFSLVLDPLKISNVTLEFRTSYQAYQLGVKCDTFYSDLWYSSTYGYVQVTPEQRDSYKCSDMNFTVSVSSDFYEEELTVFVYDYYNTTEIGRYSFISDQTTASKYQLTEGKAAQYGLQYQEKNDFQISLTYPSTVYVEVLKCPQSQSNLRVRTYDDNHLYRNITTKGKNTFYDVFNATDGNYYYRVGQSYHSSPDIFIKYQRTYQQNLRYIDKYINNIYIPGAKVKQDKVIVRIPQIQTQNSEPVEFHIAILHNNWGNAIECAYGDSNFENYNSVIVSQYSQYQPQEEILDFPTRNEGFYTIHITAIVTHGTIKQTIPYEPVEVYYSAYRMDNNLLIYILTPIFVSVLALFGIIVGGCKYRYKKKQQQEIEQQQVQEETNSQATNRNYFGVQ